MPEHDARHTYREYESGLRPVWCPGCGDFAVLSALKRAMADLDLDPDMTVLVTGIGCSSQISHYLRTYGMHTLHGRLLPVALGVRAANPDLTVICAGGDGDAFAIGMGHFMHAVRRNIDVCYIIMDNQTYGLTKGQTSPTSPRGYVSKTTPSGSIEHPIDASILAVCGGATFVAQGFSGIPEHIERLISKGVSHHGFALVRVFSPCVTFNRVNTYRWYRENTVTLEGDRHHDPSDRASALALLLKHEKIPLGIIYEDDSRTTFEEEAFAGRRPVDLPTGEEARRETLRLMRDLMVG